MICEMCGKEVPVTKPVFIAGAKLNVRSNCSKFGDDYRATQSKGGSAGPSAQVIEQRLQRREQRMQTKDVYRGAETVASRLAVFSVVKGLDILTETHTPDHMKPIKPIEFTVTAEHEIEWKVDHFGLSRKVRLF